MEVCKNHGTILGIFTPKSHNQKSQLFENQGPRALTAISSCHWDDDTGPLWGFSCILARKNSVGYLRISFCTYLEALLHLLFEHIIFFDDRTTYNKYNSSCPGFISIRYISLWRLCYGDHGSDPGDRRGAKSTYRKELYTVSIGIVNYYLMYVRLPDLIYDMYICVYTYIYIIMYNYVYIQYIYTYICIYIYTYHIYIHTYIWPFAKKSWQKSCTSCW